MGNVSENVRRVMERVERAADRAGRPVTLVAASKMNGAPQVREAFEAGIRAFGENRFQELDRKLAENAYAGARVHFIGHLQRNKVRALVGRADLIQSVDSPELIALIGKRAVELGITQDTLLEVNIGREAAKSGAEPERLPELLSLAAATPGIRVLGLMAIPPAGAEKEKTSQYFCKMYNLFVDIGAKKYDNVNMSILSMGMSADFELAIACGANMVRVGSAIFGERHYPTKQ